jgi:hypothetical protein
MQQTSSVTLFLTLLFVTSFLICLIAAVPQADLQASPRAKKHAADQRIAELQALIALANGLPGESSMFGHGYIDPFAAGRRRRRSVQPIARDTVKIGRDSDDPSSSADSVK